jgi:hypothetical protein
MLTQSVREALRAERERLMTQVRAIDSLLQADDAPTMPTPIDGALTHSGNGTGEGLRTIFRRILAASSRGMTVAELATAVEAAGWRPKGTTSTVTLLHGDMHRLVKQGKIMKIGKRYSLAQGSLP